MSTATSTTPTFKNAPSMSSKTKSSTFINHTNITKHSKTYTLNKKTTSIKSTSQIIYLMSNYNSIGNPPTISKFETYLYEIFILFNLIKSASTNNK